MDRFVSWIPVLTASQAWVPDFVRADNGRTLPETPSPVTSVMHFVLSKRRGPSHEVQQ